MFSQIKQSWQNRQIKKSLTLFLNEMEKNLELFYVMDQRQFITAGFHLNEWERFKGSELVKKHEAIQVYGQALEAFNRLYKDHKEYEQWYSADMSRKNPDNARKLHGMKHDLDTKLKSLEVIIITAGQELEKEMLQKGLLQA